MKNHTINCTLNSAKCGSSVSLPAAVFEYLPQVSEVELKVFLCILSSCPKVNTADICERVFGPGADSASSANIREVENAIAFWRGTGLIKVTRSPSSREVEREVGAESPTPVADKPVSVAALPAASPPARLEALDVFEPDKSSPAKPAGKEAKPSETYYPIAEIAGKIENCPPLKFLINKSQQKLSRMFNPSELNVVYNMYEAMGLSADYILMLIDYLVKKGKTQIRYIEKTAISLVKDGVTTGAQLEAYIQSRAKTEETESKLRALFGIGDRALTANERKYFGIWLGEYGLSYEMIVMGFEISVEKTIKVSYPYMHKIFSTWHEKGFTTPEQVRSENKPAQNNYGGTEIDVKKLLEIAANRDY